MFVAIELPLAARQVLAGIGATLHQRDQLLKVVSPDLLHITIRFLGDVAPSRVDDVTGAVNQAVRGERSFQLRLSGAGRFPARGIPRVIWCGLERDAGLDSATRLFHKLEAALISGGFPPESRPFAPHITLARARDNLTSGDAQTLEALLAGINSTQPPCASFEVRHLTAMKSDLGSGKPRYTPIIQSPLMDP
ncbi:MAG: RNA 2',3'-cyclic phosphodiesterase [Chloroflexota bacterium]